MHKSQIIKSICQALFHEKITEAKEIAQKEYPANKFITVKRTYAETQSMQVFIRDGFIDRYSGKQLLFPGTIRLLSIILPQEFPFHPNWKMSESHNIYWEFFPTIDHIVPIARGGVNNESNWVCTSMLRNSAKSNWT